MKKTEKIYYGWIVTAACAMIYFSAVGLGYNLFTMFQMPLADRIGMTGTQSSAMITILTCAGAVGAVLAGPVYAKHSVRRFSFFFGALIGAGYLVLEFSHTLLQVYGGIALIGFAYGSGGIIPANIIMNRWFFAKKGLAFGLASAGSGIATILCPAMVNGLLSAAGLSGSLLIHGSTIVILAAVSFLLLRDRPEDKGLQPYGLQNDQTQDAGMEYGAVLRDVRFYLLMIATCLCAAIIMPIFAQLAAIVNDAGYSAAAGTLAVSLFGGFMLLGKPLYGTIIDRMGMRASNVYTGLVLLACLASGAMLTKSSIFVVLLGAFIGLGGSMGTIGPAAWLSRLIGGKSYARCYSLIMLAYLGGGGLGALIPGIIRDLTGSYHAMFYVDLLFLVPLFLIIDRLFSGKSMEKKPEKDCVKMRK